MNDLIRQLNALSCFPGYRQLVAPFGKCPPSSAINTITAGVAEIVSFTANSATSTVLDNGEHLTLRWTVHNAPTVTITRDTAGAPLLSRMAEARYASDGGQPRVRRRDPHRTRRVALHPAGVGSVRRGRVTHGAGVLDKDAAITHRDDPGDAVAADGGTLHARVVERKPTVVRVLIRHGLAGWGGNIVPNVTGSIRMFRNGAWSGWIDATPAGVRPMQATPGTSITVTGSPSFNVTAETLNFMLPWDWASGTAKYQVEVRVSGFGAVGSYGGVSQTVRRNSPSLTYTRRHTLQFRYVRVNWNGGGAPSTAVCENTIRGAIPLLPTPTAGIAPAPGVAIESRTSKSDDEVDVAPERRRMLDDFDDLHNCDFWEELTEWLGSDCPADDGAIWVLIPGDDRRGEADAIPSNVCYTPPNNGPYAAHEISHCLNQEHVRLPASGKGAPEGGDAASAWPNNAMQVDVPFDTAGKAWLQNSGGARSRARSQSRAQASRTS